MFSRGFWVNTLEDAIKAAAGAVVGAGGIHFTASTVNLAIEHYGLAALGAAATVILTALSTTKRGNAASGRFNKYGDTN